MHQQRQVHQLGQTWRAEDHAKHSQQAAYAAQQYHQLIANQSGVIEARFAQLEQEIRFLREENRQIKSASSEPRNQAIVWGIGSAIVGSLVMSLVLAPSNPPPRNQSNNGITFQIGGF
jgi:hypothetical protein